MPSLRSAMESFLRDWRRDVAAPWRRFLDGVEPAFDGIDGSLRLDSGTVIFPGRKGRPPPGAPAGSHVFRALDGITPGRVRAVVVGQDPYPRVSRATGRAFEQGDLDLWTAPAVAQSLKRIIQSAAHFRTRRRRYVGSGGWSRLVDDLESGALDLEAPAATFDGWQRQGVLFLNTGLTLTKYRQGGHPHQLKGHIPLWAPVVGAICQRLAARADTPVVFLSWGSKARQFLARAGVLRSARRPARVRPGLASTAVVDRDHPAVASFLAGPNLFGEANGKLERLGAASVAW